MRCALFGLIAFMVTTLPGRTEDLKLKGVVAGHGNPIVDVCVSPDGRWIAAVAYQDVPLVYEAKSGFVASVLMAHKWGQGFEGTCVAFSPDGKRLLTGGADKKIVVWATGTWKQEETWERHDGAITCLGFSEDGKFVASGSDDKTVRVYAAGNGKPLAKFEGLAKPARAVAFSKDGTRVIVSTDEGNHAWDVVKKESVTVSDADRDQLLTSATGRRLCRSSLRGNTAKLNLGVESRRMLGASPDNVSTVDVAENGSTVAAGTKNGEVLVWTTAESYRGYLTHNRRSNGVSYTPDGKSQLAHGDNRLIRRHPGTGYIESEAKIGGFHPPAWSKDGKVSAFACEKGIQLFEDGKPGEVLRVSEWTARNGFTLSDDGKWLATMNNSNGGESVATLWDVELAKAKHTFPVGGYAKGVAISPDGKTAVAWSADSGGVDLVDAPKAKGIWRRNTTEGQNKQAGAERVVFTSDGQQLVLQNSKAVMVWSARSGEEIARHEFKDAVFAIAVSPDKKWIAASTRETVDRQDKYRIHLWQFDPKAQRPLRHLAFADGHPAAVISLAFSPDGKELAASDGFGSLRLWEVSAN